MDATWQPRISLQSDDGNVDFEDTGAKLQTNNDGERYVDLGKKKRVTVRTFKGNSPLSCTYQLLTWKKE